MTCPRCGAAMRTIDYEGARIESCTGCGGEWLDDGELKRLVRTVEATFPQEIRDSLDAVNKNVFTIDESPDNELSCPVCPDAELNRFNYASSSGIALDRCTECGGIWLDRDELERVQALVEEWNSKLEEDKAKFGPVLEQVRQEVDEEFRESAKISRFGSVNAILRGILARFG